MVSERKRRSLISSDEEDVKDLLKAAKRTSERGKAYSGFEGIKFNLKCKNKKQKDYSNLIKESDITICTGPAGTGKSYVAVATALELLRDPESPYKKLVLMVAPLQVDGLDVGYLGGDLQAKLDPFSLSYLYNMADMIGGMDKVERLVAEGWIEVLCVSFARGINIKNSIIIVAEAQGYGTHPFLTILTRLNSSSKMIIEGDVAQVDNKYVRLGKEQSGLEHALDNLEGIEGISMIEFNKQEVVRNPIITKILTQWDPETYGDFEDYGFEGGDDEPEQ